MTTIQILASLSFRDTEDVFCALSIEMGLDVPATAPLRSLLRAQRHEADRLLSMYRAGRIAADRWIADSEAKHGKVGA